MRFYEVLPVRQCRVLLGFPATDSGGAGEPNAPPSEPPALGSEPAAPDKPEDDKF